MAASPWGYWPLQEMSGDFADVSGAGRTGTAAGSLSRSVAGPKGEAAVAFAGSVGVGTSSAGILIGSAFNLAASWTVAGWCWQASEVSQGYLLGSNTNLPTSDYWSLTTRGADATVTTGFMLLNRRSGTTTFNPSSVPVLPADSQWHHFAVTRDGDAMLRFYIDGNLSHEGMAPAPPPWVTALSIGRVNSGDSLYAFTGRLAHIHAHQSVLSAEQIATLADAPFAQIKELVHATARVVLEIL